MGVARKEGHVVVTLWVNSEQPAMVLVSVKYRW